MGSRFPEIQLTLTLTPNPNPNPNQVGSRFPEIQGVISEVGDEIEDEISLLKIEARSRWSATATKLEGLPREIPKMNSLAELRMYVADLTPTPNP